MSQLTGIRNYDDQLVTVTTHTEGKKSEDKIW